MMVVVMVVIYDGGGGGGGKDRIFVMQYTCTRPITPKRCLGVYITVRWDTCTGMYRHAVPLYQRMLCRPRRELKYTVARWHGGTVAAIVFQAHCTDYSIPYARRYELRIVRTVRTPTGCRDQEGDGDGGAAVCHNDLLVPRQPRSHSPASEDDRLCLAPLAAPLLLLLAGSRGRGSPIVAGGGAGVGCRFL